MPISWRYAHNVTKLEKHQWSSSDELIQLVLGVIAIVRSWLNPLNNYNIYIGMAKRIDRNVLKIKNQRILDKRMIN